MAGVLRNVLETLLQQGGFQLQLLVVAAFELEQGDNADIATHSCAVRGIVNVDSAVVGGVVGEIWVRLRVHEVNVLQFVVAVVRGAGAAVDRADTAHSQDPSQPQGHLALVDPFHL